MTRRARRGRRRALAAALAFACGTAARGAGTESFDLQTPYGPVGVGHIAPRGDGPRPAVIVLSGSRGFGSVAYAEIGAGLTRVGIDVFELHALSEDDIREIAEAEGARARIGFYTAALPRWTAAVHALVARLRGGPRGAAGIGLLGISLGAEIAAEAAAGQDGVRALVLVDGAPPAAQAATPRALPPLLLIWGGADQVFRPDVARRLRADALRRGGKAALKIYEGGGHDFFLQPGTALAASAQGDAAAFLADQLR